MWLRYAGRSVLFTPLVERAIWSDFQCLLSYQMREGTLTMPFFEKISGPAMEPLGGREDSFRKRPFLKRRRRVPRGTVVFDVIKVPEAVGELNGYFTRAIFKELSKWEIVN